MRECSCVRDRKRDGGGAGVCVHEFVRMCEFGLVCVCEKRGAGERVYVCVCVCEREREGKVT